MLATGGSRPGHAPPENPPGSPWVSVLRGESSGGWRPRAVLAEVTAEDHRLLALHRLPLAGAPPLGALLARRAQLVRLRIVAGPILSGSCRGSRDRHCQGICAGAASGRAADSWAAAGPRPLNRGRLLLQRLAFTLLLKITLIPFRRLFNGKFKFCRDAGN